MPCWGANIMVDATNQLFNKVCADMLDALFRGHDVLCGALANMAAGLYGPIFAAGPLSLAGEGLVFKAIGRGTSEV